MNNIDIQIKNYNEASKRDPRKSSYGFLEVNTSMGVYDQYYFLWFDTIESLLTFLKEDFPINIDEEYFEDYLEFLSKIINSINSNGLTQENLDEFNTYNFPSSYIGWWGSFNGLIKGGNSNTTKLINTFLENQDGLTKEISEDNIQHFIEYLNELRDQ